MPIYLFEILTTSASGDLSVEKIKFDCDNDTEALAKAEAIVQAIKKESQDSCNVSVRDQSNQTIGNRVLVR